MVGSGAVVGRKNFARDQAKFQALKPLPTSLAPEYATITDDVGDHCGMIAAIFLINILDNFFAPIMLDIEIDVSGSSLSWTENVQTEGLLPLDQAVTPRQ
jgi:hypothetical protein